MSVHEAALPLARITLPGGPVMACAEAGEGPPVLFLHGNPTSSYLWRNVIPHVASVGRCIAPDLVGMGASDKLPGEDPARYRFAAHSRFLDQFIDAVLPGGDVVLVLHDWGSALGFDWACRNPRRVRGIAYMEAIVAPMSWSQWPEASRSLFQALRSPAGESLILERNVFIERILPGSILRRLDEAEMDAYRRPFLSPGEDRRPMLTWPRELPVDGEPADVVARVDRYARWLSASMIPKLFIDAEPGAILTGELREFCRQWPSQDEVRVAGSHFIQEDSPDEIGSAVASWLRRLPAAAA